MQFHSEVVRCQSFLILLNTMGWVDIEFDLSVSLFQRRYTVNRFIAL